MIQRGAMLLRFTCAAALTACTINNYNGGPLPDAHAAAADAPVLAGDPTSCGAPLPSTAPPTIHISGTALGPHAGVPGMTVALVDVGATTPRVTVSTTASGQYDLVAPTGGVPIDGYLHFSGPGYVDTYVYPAVPYAQDTHPIGFEIADPNLYATYSAGGATPQAPDDAFLFARVFDCSYAEVTGATVTVEPTDHATVSYPNASQAGAFSSSTSTYGEAYINNVTPGAVRIGGTAGAGALRGHVVEARANAFTYVVVTP